MRSITVLGVIIILTGWFALVEYDKYPESEQKEMRERIKNSPLALIAVALMPVGILTNALGSLIGSIWLTTTGATFIFIQSIIMSLLFWKRKRWKSILLLVTMIILGLFLYLPLFLYF